MEILSTGAKIKRARIYKGLTLKDICLDKVSVSKMSCIENDKVKPEKSILLHIAKMLDMDPEYLKQDVKDQLLFNLEELKKDKSGEYEKRLEYNLEFSQKYGYYEISFDLMHLLAKYYLENNKLENIQVITAKYYEACQLSNKNENHMTYYMDMAQYLFRSKEYLEAASYLNNVRKYCAEMGDFKTMSSATYDEAACYLMVDNYERSYEIGVRLKDLLQYFDKEVNKARACQLLAMLSLRIDKDKFHEYEKMAMELYGDNEYYKAMAIYNYAVVMFDLDMKEDALSYMETAFRIYPKEDTSEYVEFILMTIEELIENKIFDKANDVCSIALDDAIKLDNIKFIERAYYYKAVILTKQGSIHEAEIYMNLSLDALLKFGTKPDLYKRYLDLGEMYYKLNNVADSIKYFNLSIQLKKEI